MPAVYPWAGGRSVPYRPGRGVPPDTPAAADAGVGVVDDGLQLTGEHLQDRQQLLLALLPGPRDAEIERMILRRGALLRGLDQGDLDYRDGMHPEILEPISVHCAVC